MGTVRALAVVVVLLLMPGCQMEPSAGIRVINDTRSTVMVTTLDGDGRLSPGATLTPGDTAWFGQAGNCGVNVQLRAFSAAGQQIQAKDGLCAGDTWYVTATATPAPPDH